MCTFAPTMTQLDEKLFALVRAAMNGDAFEAPLTDDDWRWLYKTAVQQSMLGVCYMERADMPKDVAINWVTKAEMIRKMSTARNAAIVILTVFDLFSITLISPLIVQNI